MQSNLNAPDADNLWRQLAPHLEAAMSRLGERDRTLLALRFYENKTGAETAALLGIREAAAHKRTARALEKLRKIFTKRGVHSTAETIAGTISANSVQAAPVALAKAVTAVAIAKGATASISTLTLIKGALTIMAWTKAKTAIVAGVIVLLAVGTTTVTIQEVRGHRPYPWQVENSDYRILARVPPQVKIVPTIFSPKEGWNGSNGQMLGMGQSISNLLAAAYDTSKYQMVFSAKLPDSRYDFIANLPEGNNPALQREIKRRFNLIGARTEMRDTDVLLLTVKYKNASGLKHSANKSSDGSGNNGAGHYHWADAPLSELTGFLENYFEIPVVDRTGLAGQFDINIKWAERDADWKHRKPDALKQVLLDQLGLELVPTNMPVEMLVVEKVK